MLLMQIDVIYETSLGYGLRFWYNFEICINIDKSSIYEIIGFVSASNDSSSLGSRGRLLMTSLLVFVFDLRPSLLLLLLWRWLPLLLTVLLLPPPPPFLDEVDELDRGEKDETLLLPATLPKLEFSLHAASTFPVDPVWNPDITGFLGIAKDAGIEGIFWWWVEPNEVFCRDQDLSSMSSSEASLWSVYRSLTLLSLSSESTGTKINKKNDLHEKHYTT